MVFCDLLSVVSNNITSEDFTVDAKTVEEMGSPGRITVS